MASKYEELPSSVCATKGGLCFYPQYNPFVQFEVIAACHVTYLAVIFGLRLLLKNARPMNLKYVMMAYNIIQVIASATETIALAPFVKNYLFNINGSFNSTIEFWVFFHYLTKYLDMFDSLFMVLRQKGNQLSFLHVYHHTTIGAIWGTLLHFGYGNGAAFFGVWINSLVHTLMYFHYFWTSLGFKNPLKKYLTLFQMFQFSLCILQAILVVLFDRQFTFNWAMLQLCYHITLLALFYNFFIKSNRKPSAGGKTVSTSAINNTPEGRSKRKAARED